MGTVLQLYLVEISRRFSISLVKSISSSGIFSDSKRFFAATQKGQFLVFNPDHTGHGTENLTNIPRDTIMIVAKRNEWLDSLADNTTMTFVDVDELVKSKELLAA